MPSPSLSPQIVDALAAQLTSAFRVLSTQRYGHPIVFERRAPSSDPAAPIDFHLDPLDGPPITVRVTASHVGGNVYDVEATFDDGPSLALPYCLPALLPVLIADDPPQLARTLASFLLDTLEKQLGTHILRDHLQRKLAAADSSSATAARARPE